jgi:molecular chaperone GrpE (heat shock protein)
MPLKDEAKPAIRTSALQRLRDMGFSAAKDTAHWLGETADDAARLASAAKRKIGAMGARAEEDARRWDQLTNPAAMAQYQGPPLPIREQVVGSLTDPAQGLFRPPTSMAEAANMVSMLIPEGGGLGAQSFSPRIKAMEMRQDALTKLRATREASPEEYAQARAEFDRVMAAADRMAESAKPVDEIRKAQARMMNPRIRAAEMRAEAYNNLRRVREAIPEDASRDAYAKSSQDFADALDQANRMEALAKQWDEAQKAQAGLDLHAADYISSSFKKPQR